MENQNQFEINAKTFTFKGDNDKNIGGILCGKKFIIPVYQRPYSWDWDKQVKKFIDDIFISFWGVDANLEPEPMFIGTMQLSLNNNNDKQQNVIDGQQRLTTFLLLLRALQIKFPRCEELTKTKLDFLDTKVNGETQNKNLKEALEHNLNEDVSNTINLYLKNLYSIYKNIEEYIKTEEQDDNKIDNELVNKKFNIINFVYHILNNVYFVVIETRAGLSKTLQIFNAINTTGLDLNGGDIFKIRMYEYLFNKKNEDDNKIFDSINELYQTIDNYNKKHNRIVIDIRGILQIYQYIIICKFNMPNVLYGYGVDTFFEQLFDTIANNNKWEHFKNHIEKVELSIEDIKKIIEIRFMWEDKWIKCENFTAEDVCLVHFIWWSRYSRYWLLIFVFLFRYQEKENSWNSMLEFNKKLAIFYIIYSVRFQKAINNAHSFTYNLIKKMFTEDIKEIINEVDLEVDKNKDEVDKNKNSNDLKNILNGDIAHNAKLKNILCRLSAMIEEKYATNKKEEIEHIEKLIFKIEIDIEHIQSYHDKDKNIRKDIWDKWGTDINSIGNLMILEQEINRSISNKEYKTKIDKTQAQNYDKSSFEIVKKQIEKYSEWNLEMCKEKKEYEVDKILKYLFS